MAKEEITTPHAVIRLCILKEYSKIKAWRKYLGLTQDEVAQKIGTSQASFAQMEKANDTPREYLLVKIAKAFGITVEQLQE